MKLTFPKALTIILVFYILFYFISLNNVENTTSTRSTYSTSSSTSPSSITKQSSSTKTTLSSVKSWFENNKSAVKSNFITYLSSQTINSQTISNINITDIKFRFDSELGCYYLLYFTCKVGKSTCSGHARGFLEYEGDTVYWWSLEIGTNTKILIDTYDDNYDDIVLQHYNELIKKYQ